MSSVSPQVRAALKTKVMSENRRKKIEGIKQREQLRDYKTRLQTMLVQKLISKYGDRGKSNTTKNLKIKELVKDFVKRSRNINDREIRQLELEAKVVVNKVEESNKAKTSMDYGRGAKQAARDMRVEEERGTSQSQRAPVPKLKPPVPKQDLGSEDGELPPEVKRNEWMLLDAYNGINAEEESKKISSKKQTQQHVFKDNLDRQINLRKQRVVDEKKDEIKYLRDQEVQLSEWRQDQQKARRIIEDKIEVEKRVRAQQIAENKRIKEAEKKKKYEREIRELEVCANEIKRQEINVHSKKLQERERQRLVRLENEKDQLVRQARALEEAEEDKRLMREYEAKLEREDFERANAFQRRLEKLEASGAKWAEEGAGKKQADDDRKIELMILDEAARKEAADDERERRDKAKLLSDAKMIMQTNLELSRRKKAREAAVKEEDMKYASMYRNQGEKYQRDEIKRKAEIMNREKKHQALLEKQMKEHRDDPAKMTMSNTERGMNAILLDKIHADPALKAKVIERLNRGKMPQSPDDKSKYGGGLAIGMNG